MKNETSYAAFLTLRLCKAHIFMPRSYEVVL